MTLKVRRQIKEFSLQNKNEESCGVIIHKDGNYNAILCRNLAENRKYNFVVDPKDYFKASKMGQICCIFHSQTSIIPSELDIINSKGHNIPSLIYSIDKDDFTFLDPSNLTLNKYIGRNFELGKNDCLTLVQDYYKNELNINISNFDRNSAFSELDSDIIIKSYKNEGFKIIELDEINKYDLIGFRFKNKNIHHLAVYLGQNLFLHHQGNKYSNVEIFTKEYKKRAELILRHKTLW